MDTQSNSSTGSQYLQEVLGDVLADALSKVAKDRPIDPIQYVADYLHGLKINNSAIEDNQETDQQTDNYQEEIKDDIEDEIKDEIRDDFDETDFKETESTTEFRTTQSEPPPSIDGSFVTVSNPGSGTSQSTIFEESPKRTQSLDRESFQKKAFKGGRKSTSFSKHLPAVAMSKNDYRARRGLLPQMSQSPKSSPSAEIPRRNHNFNKPKQLAPLDDSFDLDRHNRRNKKLSKSTIKLRK